jgi:hypothetical protein
MASSCRIAISQLDIHPIYVEVAQGLDQTPGTKRNPYHLPLFIDLKAVSRIRAV